MDIAALSMSLAQVDLSAKVGMKVMGLMKEQVEMSGQSLIQDLQQMELSVNPNVGSQIDIKL